MPTVVVILTFSFYVQLKFYVHLSSNLEDRYRSSFRVVYSSSKKFGAWTYPPVKNTFVGEENSLSLVYFTRTYFSWLSNLGHTQSATFCTRRGANIQIPVIQPICFHKIMHFKKIL